MFLLSNVLAIIDIFLKTLTNAITRKVVYIQRFSLKWKAVIPGSNWYHSHSAYQRGDGLLGMYIVRLPPESEVHSRHYDYDLTDHYIIAQEWFHGVILLKSYYTELYLFLYFGF